MIAPSRRRRTHSKVGAVERSIAPVDLFVVEGECAAAAQGLLMNSENCTMDCQVGVGRKAYVGRSWEHLGRRTLGAHRADAACSGVVQVQKNRPGGELQMTCTREERNGKAARPEAYRGVRGQDRLVALAEVLLNGRKRRKRASFV